MIPCDGEVTCINGCCKKNPCQNGGTCTEICEPTSVRDQPNWHAYLIRPAYLAWLGAQSTHWRATCRYDADGVNYTDYMRTSLADCNILTMQKELGTCFQFEFINIRGHECFNCTVPLWNQKGVYSLHTDTSFKNCEFDGKTGSVHREDNFGHYVHYNSLHRCSSGPNATTQFWLGGK